VPRFNRFVSRHQLKRFPTYVSGIAHLSQISLLDPLPVFRQLVGLSSPAVYPFDRFICRAGFATLPVWSWRVLRQNPSLLIAKVSFCEFRMIFWQILNKRALSGILGLNQM
jgi:hypothetical protein